MEQFLRVVKLYGTEKHSISSIADISIYPSTQVTFSTLAKFNDRFHFLPPKSERFHRLRFGCKARLRRERLIREPKILK